MRNLNFRVWDKHFKIMGEVVSIDFQESWIIAKGFPLSKRATDDNDDCWGISFMKAKIMQSTGYKDWNGIEIFEGDILHILSDYGEESILPVYWNKEANALMINLEIEDFEQINFGWAPDWVNRITIIGNIYQNPELLEKKE